MLGGFELCGVSGCSGGGFGVAADGRWVSWVCCGIIGALYFLSLVFVPWIRLASLRALLSAAIAIAVGGAVALLYSLALR